MNTPGPKTSVVVSLLVMGALCICGCNESGPTGPEPEVSVDQKSSSIEDGSYPQTVTRYTPTGKGGVTGRGNAVIPSMVEPELGELDWTKPEQKPSISLELAADDHLMVKLTEDSTAETPEFVAVWRKPGESVEVAGKTVPVYTTFTSGPLASKEAALALLKAYAGRDESFQNAVEWREVEEK